MIIRKNPIIWIPESGFSIYPLPRELLPFGSRIMFAMLNAINSVSVSNIIKVMKSPPRFYDFNVFSNNLGPTADQNCNISSE